MRYKVPATFYLDHVSRDLPGGTVIKSTKTYVLVELTEEERRELLSDASYYSTDWKYMGREFMGLGKSAAATVRALQS